MDCYIPSVHHWISHLNARKVKKFDNRRIFNVQPKWINSKQSTLGSDTTKADIKSA